MSELDCIKEKINYMKIWLGMLVVTDISLFGWLVTHALSASSIIVVGGVVAVLVITSAIALIHHRIDQRIDQLRDL